jgi:hypothetical protein
MRPAGFWEWLLDWDGGLGRLVTFLSLFAASFLLGHFVLALAEHSGLSVLMTGIKP